jgi:sugar-specific transcriptional regulator TrmB
VFEILELSDYQESTLETLLTMGRSTAPNLAEATGVPKARIYGVLEELANRGFIEVTPSRPKEYEAKPPAELLDRAVTNRRQDFETVRAELEAAREAFLEEWEPRYRSTGEAVSPAEELFYVVDVGEPSERETRLLYEEAADTIYVITKSFEYLTAVHESLSDVLDRGIEVKVLFLHPDALSAENRAIQTDIVAELDQAFPRVDYRFNPGPLPLRGTFRDPSMEYEAGKAILLVEEKDIPLSMRQAAITENAPFVAGLKRFFDLLWEHDSRSEL